MKEFDNIKVTQSDPYLSAEKWNASIEFTEAFERIISSMLGKTFKGIYRPNGIYNTGDYVWYEGKFYVINDANYRNIYSIGAKNYSSSFRSDSAYIALNSEGDVAVVNNGFEKTICKGPFDGIYVCNGEKFAITTSGDRLYRIEIATGQSTELNLQFDSDIDKVLCDSFSVYILKENKLYSGENVYAESTYFEEIFSSPKRIIDIEVSDSYFIILYADKNIDVCSKDFTSIYSMNASVYITDIEKSKIATCEDETMALFDGNDTVSFFFIDSSGNAEFTESLKNEYFISAKTMTANEGMVVMNDEFGITSFDIGRYNKTEIDVRELIINNGAAPTDKLSFAVSYKNGNVSSSAGTRKAPDSNASTNIVPGKGITGGTIKYSGVDFLNKTVVIEGTYSGSQGNYEIGYITGAGKKVPLALKGVKPGRFKLIVTTDSSMNGTSNLFQDLMTSYQNTSTNSSEQGALSLSLSSTTVAAVYAVDEIIDDSKQYMLNKTELHIPATYEKNAYPYAPAVADENGVVNLKRKNNSLAVDSSGYYVSTSDRTDLADSFTVASSLAVKLVMDEIVEFKAVAGQGYTPLGNAQSKYNTAEKIGKEIDSVSTLLTTMLPKGNVDPKYDTAEKIVLALTELLSRPACPHRIGDYLHTENGTNPAVSWPGTKWERIYDRFLMATSSGENPGSLGGSDTVKLTTAMIPSHSHSIPSHSHTRGTMNITGTLPYRNGGESLTGAFIGTSKEVKQSSGDGTGRWVNFDASKTWTGSTSSVSLSTNSSGSGTPFSILPPYRKVHIWKRIS